MNLPDQMQAILRAIDFIECSLTRPITVPEIAAVAGYSPYYFCALFSQYTCHSPYDYLIRRRMSQAAIELILDTDRKVIDTALAYQFESHEGFSRAFRRIMSICPSDAQSTGRIPYHCFLPTITGEHLICLMEEGGLQPVFVNKIPENMVKEIPVMEIPTWLKSQEPPILPPHEKSQYAVFTINHQNHLPYVINWVFHTWLFVSPVHLVKNCAYLHTIQDQMRIFLPIILKH